MRMPTVNDARRQAGRTARELAISIIPIMAGVVKHGGPLGSNKPVSIPENNAFARCFHAQFDFRTDALRSLQFSVPAADGFFAREGWFFMRLVTTSVSVVPHCAHNRRFRLQ